MRPLQMGGRAQKPRRTVNGSSENALVRGWLQDALADHPHGNDLVRMKSELESRASLEQELLLISLHGICLPRLLQLQQRRLCCDGARGGAKSEEAQDRSNAIFFYSFYKQDMIDRHPPVRRNRTVQLLPLLRFRVLGVFTGPP